MLDQLRRFDGVPMDVDVELSRIDMSVRDLLSLATGSVLRTGKRVGDPLNLRVGGVILFNAQITDSQGKAALQVVADSGKNRK